MVSHACAVSLTQRVMLMSARTFELVNRPASDAWPVHHFVGVFADPYQQIHSAVCCYEATESSWYSALKKQGAICLSDVHTGHVLMLPV